MDESTVNDYGKIRIFRSSHTELESQSEKAECQDFEDQTDYTNSLSQQKHDEERNSKKSTMDFELTKLMNTEINSSR